MVKGPPQRYQNVRFVLTACAARWGQGLQLFVYVQPDATRKVMSPVGCFLLHATWLHSEPRWRGGGNRDRERNQEDVVTAAAARCLLGVIIGAVVFEHYREQSVPLLVNVTQVSNKKHSVSAHT